MRELLFVPFATVLSEVESRGMANVFIQPATCRASIHNKSQKAIRRIVLKQGHVSVIAASISYVPRTVCVLCGEEAIHWVTTASAMKEGQGRPKWGL